ncbi:MAG: hypothetical protein BWY06_02693 [Candidatus Latescibacteria bacterium ADurb.Bin168]|nr:MAG: hypothetical protein BWY06_02693 [Candidatus Latescibacteria bacterium ADurb.Bin168]
METVDYEKVRITGKRLRAQAFGLAVQSSGCADQGTDRQARPSGFGQWRQEILRCAQNDGFRGDGPGRAPSPRAPTGPLECAGAPALSIRKGMFSIARFPPSRE